MKEKLRRISALAVFIPLVASCATSEDASEDSRPVAMYLDRTAEDWIGDFRRDDQSAREAAVAALAALGPETAPRVAIETDDANPAVRYSALAVLVRYGEDASDLAPVAASRLSDPDPKVRAQAALALLAFGPRASDHGRPASAAALGDSDWFVRFNAIKVLASYGADAYPEGYDALRAIEHKDRDPQIRAHAAKAAEAISVDYSRRRGRPIEKRGRRDDESR